MDKRKEFEKVLADASQTPQADLVLRLNEKATSIADLGLATSQIEDVARPTRGGGLFTVSGPVDQGMSTTMCLFVQDYIRERRAAGLPDIGDVMEEPFGGVDVVDMDLR